MDSNANLISNFGLRVTPENAGYRFKQRFSVAGLIVVEKEMLEDLLVSEGMGKEKGEDALCV